MTSTPAGYRSWPMYYAAENLPYVVMIGDVGTGKSTIIQKLTNRPRLTSDQSTSYTKFATRYYTWHKQIEICDTPGSNPMEERFEHNRWIAEAMSVKPVSLLMIIVKADTRIANVIDNIIKYAEAFTTKEFTEILSVCVTHMDTVTWTRTEFTDILANQTGIEYVTFSEPRTSALHLENSIRDMCNAQRPIKFNIDSENFLRFFKINDRNFKIIKTVRKEVKRFEDVRRKFYAHLEKYIEKDQIDLIFEFQAWMTEEIVEAQKRVSKENKFKFYGENLPNEAGHIANLTNQLKMVLLEVRTRCLGYTSNHGINELRKCPHCGEVWAKIIGCDGQTTCGSMVDSFDLRSGFSGVMATFTFRWHPEQEELEIVRTGQRHIAKRAKVERGRGCGRTITWSSMALVDVPDEFTATHEVNVEDINNLQEDAQRKFAKRFDEEKSKYVVEDQVPYPIQEAAHDNNYIDDFTFLG